MKTTDRKYIALVEILVYMAIFIIVMALAFQCFHMFLKNSHDLRKASEDIIAISQIGDGWRDKVRNADSIKCEGSMFFLIRDGRETCYSYRDNALQFRGPEPDARWKILNDRIGACSFTNTAYDGFSAWEMDLELKVRNEKAKVKPLFSFIAVNKKGADGGKGANL